MQPRPIHALIFVFDADSGLWAAALDSTRKALRLGGCTLCEITHGVAGERRSFRECRDALGVPVEYLHRDEIPDELAALVGDGLPCVVARVASAASPSNADEVEHLLLLDAETIARCRGSIEDLKGKLRFHAARNDLSFD